MVQLEMMCAEGSQKQPQLRVLVTEGQSELRATLRACEADRRELPSMRVGMLRARRPRSVFE
eukprot:3251707-Prymnesium_polylepis.1